MPQILTTFSKDEFQEMLQKSVDLALNKEAKEKSVQNSQEEFLTVDEACKLLRISSRSRRLFNKSELLQSIQQGAANL